MQVTVHVDWYTKVILTLIAVVLAGLLVKPSLVSKPVSGYGGQRVVIDDTIPIRVKVVGQPITARVVNEVDTSTVITECLDALVVVDWKEEEEYIKQKLIEKFKTSGMSDEEIEKKLEEIEEIWKKWGH